MKDKFKIGITCSPVPGGSGVIASELGIQLARLGHQVHFISYSLPFRLPQYQENLFFHEVEITNYPLFKYPPYTLTLASKMAEISSDWNLDILHVHYAIPHAICAFLDTTRFTPTNPACQKEKFAPRGEKILMHMSNFRPVKRVLDVIKIFAEVKKQIPTKLILIGEGSQLDSALSLARQLC